MNKYFSRVSQYLLLFAVLSSYSIWIFGNNPTFPAFFYFQGNQVMLGLVTLVLLLNIHKWKWSDWAVIGIAIATGLYSTAVSGIKYADTPELNFVIPLILLMIECYRICPFNKVEKGILLGIQVGAVLLTMIRLVIELPKVIDLQAILEFDNTLTSLWINVNAIGASILVSVMLSTILIKSYGNRWWNLMVLPIYMLGLIGTWACQSQTSLAILLVFIFIDNCLPKMIFQKMKVWLLSFFIIFIGTPFMAHGFAESTTIDIFTGRETIWHDFFSIWLTKTEYILNGLGVFVNYKGLSTHNSYLYTLSNYGIIGYILLFGTLSFFIFTLLKQASRLTKTQVSLLFAFLLLCVYTMMEDTFLVASWMPVIYIFLGLALAESREIEIKQAILEKEETELKG
ncbi:MAG: EpaQ family protein [Enterococcus sp.]